MCPFTDMPEHPPRAQPSYVDVTPERLLER
jgi:hypothetical protein